MPLYTVQGKPIKGKPNNMGMSATQANLLFLTSRLHDVENAAQFIEGEKIALATQQDAIYQTYCDALDATKIQVAFNSVEDGKRYFVDATFDSVCAYDSTRCKQYSLADAKTGKIYVTPEMKDAYEDFKDDKYSFAWEMLRLGDNKCSYGNWNGEWGSRVVSVSDNGCSLTDVEELVYRRHAEGFGINSGDAKNELNNLYANYLNILVNEGASNDDKLKALFEFRDFLYTTYGSEIHALMKLDKQATVFPGFADYVPSLQNNGETDDDYQARIKQEYQSTLKTTDWYIGGISLKANSICKMDYYNNDGNLVYRKGETVKEDISDLNNGGRQIVIYSDFEDWVAVDGNYSAYIATDKEIGDDSFPRSEFNYYLNMWQSITNAGGCTEVPLGAQNGNEANDWFNDMVKSGRAIINVYNENIKEWGETNVATSVNVNFLQENQDETDLKKAEAEYEYQLGVIEKKDTELDRKLSKLETERNSIKQIMESIKTVKDENIDRTFNIFS